MTHQVTKQSSHGADAAYPSQIRAGRLGDQLCFALYSATHAMTRAYRPLLAEIGLTYPQFLVMLVLWERESCRLGEIAEELLLAAHAISPIIDRLEEAGVVTRVEDEADGRAVRVELTSVGRSLEAKASAIQEQMRCRTSLEPETVDELRAQITALVGSLSSP